MNKDSYKSIEPLFVNKSNIKNIEEFHSKINTIFHDVESKYYDNQQQGMWSSLPEQLGKLLNKINITDSKPIKLLDLGCGTGLGTDILLRSKIQSNIKEVMLADTSQGMLDQAAKRAKKWKIKSKFHLGLVNEINEKFDLIIISSVLHHIPDLPSFFVEIERILDKEGILITLQDPLSESISSPTYKNRYEAFLKSENINKLKLKFRLINGIKRRFQILFKSINYIKEVNDILIAQKIINSPLEPKEMWSITDIHVEGLPYSNNSGISINDLKNFSQNLTLIDYITYCYYGQLKHYLTTDYKLKEEQLSKQEDKLGRNFGSIWVKH